MYALLPASKAGANMPLETVKLLNRESLLTTVVVYDALLFEVYISVPPDTVTELVNVRAAFAATFTVKSIGGYAD
ncbi:hypothetical protein PAECIP111891_04050 [Paenibacillus allorhizoplanae]|uniref:Uncharacterized protein n=1 Tax=Paenibacillus allorhizoplanae TaxID=2905648 RepID=A0ABN8GNZ7_9BACL|nr:hypothetical protein PAECIP111891_04050 [Paenibacillus allorhizoplanae]